MKKLFLFLLTSCQLFAATTNYPLLIEIGNYPGDPAAKDSVYSAFDKVNKNFSDSYSRLGASNVVMYLISNYLTTNITWYFTGGTNTYNYTTNITLTNGTLTNVYITNLTTTNVTYTNAVITNVYVTNLVSLYTINTNTYTTNITEVTAVTNLIYNTYNTTNNITTNNYTTNRYTTNLFYTTNITQTTILSNTYNTTNLITTNTFTTNYSITNFYITTNLITTNIFNTTNNYLTVTNTFTTNILNTNIFITTNNYITNLFTSNYFSTNFYTTNFYTTNLYTSNFYTTNFSYTTNIYNSAVSNYYYTNYTTNVYVSTNDISISGTSNYFALYSSTNALVNASMYEDSTNIVGLKFLRLSSGARLDGTNVSTNNIIRSIDTNGILQWSTEFDPIAAVHITNTANPHETGLTNLNDVSFYLPIVNQILKFNGSAWVNSYVNFNELTNGGTLNYIPKWNSSSRLSSTSSIFDNGSVGIGLANPSYQAHINGTLGVSNVLDFIGIDPIQRVSLVGNSGHIRSYFMENSYSVILGGFQRFGSAYASSSNKMVLFNNIGSISISPNYGVATATIFDTNGYVGILTATPLDALHVGGYTRSAYKSSNGTLGISTNKVGFTFLDGIVTAVTNTPASEMTWADIYWLSNAIWQLDHRTVDSPAFGTGVVNRVGVWQSSSNLTADALGISTNLMGVTTTNGLVAAITNFVPVPQTNNQMLVSSNGAWVLRPNTNTIISSNNPSGVQTFDGVANRIPKYWDETTLTSSALVDDGTTMISYDRHVQFDVGGLPDDDYALVVNNSSPGGGYLLSVNRPADKYTTRVQTTGYLSGKHESSLGSVGVTNTLNGLIIEDGLVVGTNYDIFVEGFGYTIITNPIWAPTNTYSVTNLADFAAAPNPYTNGQVCYYSTNLNKWINTKLTTNDINNLVTVLSDLQSQINGKQASLGSGTTTEYLRGDKTWATVQYGDIGSRPNGTAGHVAAFDGSYSFSSAGAYDTTGTADTIAKRDASGGLTAAEFDANIIRSASPGGIYFYSGTSVLGYIGSAGFTPAGGYNSSDTTAGATANVQVRNAAGTGTVTLQFKNGLFVGSSAP